MRNEIEKYIVLNKKRKIKHTEGDEKILQQNKKQNDIKYENKINKNENKVVLKTTIIPNEVNKEAKPNYTDQTEPCVHKKINAYRERQSKINT